MKKTPISIRGLNNIDDQIIKKGVFELKEFDDLEKAIYAKRHDGRIKEIREAFDAYTKTMRDTSLWQRLFKKWFKNEN